MDLASQLLILFFLILVGYGARKGKVLPPGSGRVLVELVLRITLPALILVSMSIPREDFLLRALGEVGGLALSLTLLVFFAAGRLARRLPLGPPEQNQWIFGITFGNVTFIGYPVLFLLLGSEGVFLGAVFDFVQSLLMFTVGVWTLAGSRGAPARRERYRLLVNPVVGALVAGLLLFLTGQELPGGIREPLGMLGQVTTVLSMLAVGMLLEFRRLQARGVVWSQGLLAVAKLVLVPVLVWLVLTPLPVLAVSRTVVLVMFATPCAILTSVLGERYGGDGRFAAGAVFLTHLGCILTIPLLLTLARLP